MWLSCDQPYSCWWMIYIYFIYFPFFTSFYLLFLPHHSYLLLFLLYLIHATSSITSPINRVLSIEFYQLSPINWVISNLLIFTSISYGGEAFTISKMSLGSFYIAGKFISPRLTTFIACKIVYYWNSINYSVRLPSIVSFHLIDESITSVVRPFSSEIVLIIQFVCHQNPTILNYPNYSKVDSSNWYISISLSRLILQQDPSSVK